MEYQHPPGGPPGQQLRAAHQAADHVQPTGQGASLAPVHHLSALLLVVDFFQLAAWLADLLQQVWYNAIFAPSLHIIRVVAAPLAAWLADLLQPVLYTFKYNAMSAPTVGHILLG